MYFCHKINKKRSNNDAKGKNSPLNYGFKGILGTFAHILGSFSHIYNIKEKHVHHTFSTPLPHHLRQLPHAYGAHVLHPGAHADVRQTLREGDVATRHQLHRHSAAHKFLHRSRHLHTDEGEHPKSVDATLGDGLRDARNHAAGVLVFHHVLDSLWKGGLEHSLAP